MFQITGHHKQKEKGVPTVYLLNNIYYEIPLKIGKEQLAAVQKSDPSLVRCNMISRSDTLALHQR